MAKKNKQDALQDSSGNIPKRLSELNLLVYGVIIVLFIGFAAMFAGYGTTFITNHDNQQATYQSLRDQVKDQNAKIDTLIKAIKSQKK